MSIVFQQDKSMPVTQFPKMMDMRCHTGVVDAEDCSSARSNGRFHKGHIDVLSYWLNIYEYRRGTGEHYGIGGGGKGEGWNDYLVAGRYSEQSHSHFQRMGATRG